MKSSEEKRSGLSESFIIGVIAIVFLVVGYQTALFVHQAAVVKIAANRDDPDTVYVYRTVEMDMSSHKVSAHVPNVSNDPDISKFPVVEEKAVRKNAGHDRRADAVRANIPRKKAETFRFDPNTVSVDDLCRLGFSPKQAQSIDNYRKKGGRFKRKEDFAKSYVVSDSIFNRLEPFIDIPLVDLNLADSAAFDALPGIGGWFAGKMIEYRSKLGGYSCKEQLMEIYRFDQEKYEGLKDLITVSREYVIPYPLWTLPADSLRKHPYIENYETAKAIVLYRENSPKEDWTVEKMAEAGVLSPTSATRLSRCVIDIP